MEGSFEDFYIVWNTFGVKALLYFTQPNMKGVQDMSCWLHNGIFYIFHHYKLTKLQKNTKLKCTTKYGFKTLDRKKHFIIEVQKLGLELRTTNTILLQRSRIATKKSHLTARLEHSFVTQGTWIMPSFGFTWFVFLCTALIMHDRKYISVFLCAGVLGCLWV